MKSGDLSLIYLSQSSLLDLLTLIRDGYDGNRADALTWGHKVFLSLVLSVWIYLDIRPSLRLMCTARIAIMYIAVLITFFFHTVFFFCHPPDFPLLSEP